MPKTNAENKAAERARKKKLGMKRGEFWLYPSIEKKAKSYIARLNKQAEGEK